MRNTFAKWNNLTAAFRAFLVIALAFLALGLGTLGSAQSAGKASGLWMKGANDSQQSAVIFNLSNFSEKDKDGNTTTVKLQLKNVFVNVGAIYAEPGSTATLRLGRGYAATSAFTNAWTGNLENFFYERPAEGAGSTLVTKPNALYNWVEPFEITTKIQISDYRYFRLSAENCNVLINEIVFVGEKLDSSNNGTGELVVVPATVYTGDGTVLPVQPMEGETQAAARQRALKEAGAMLDAQRIPTASSSSFFNFADEEVYSLMTIREMSVGNSYDVRNVGNYLGDKVYGPLGNDILALGTLIFGMSPFGLRFFPMLASFGVLVFGYLLTRRLTKSDKAGLIFAALYTLGNFALGFGHMGTPLMLGLFFFVAALDCMHRFYANGMKQANVRGALPLALSGLFAACAVLINGAWIIPTVGLVALFALGMVRQQTAKRYYLDKALAAAEEEEGPAPAEVPAEKTEPAAEEPVRLSPARRKVAKVVREYRYKNFVAPVMFGVFFLVGALLLSVLATLPASNALLKLYGDPAHPTIALGVFGLAWKAFAGGFVGKNVVGTSNAAWSFFYEIFRGTGDPYAVTGVSFNMIGIAGGLFGIGFACYRLITLLKGGKLSENRKELRTLLIPLAGLLLALVPTFFGGGAVGFRMLVSVFGFILCAKGLTFFMESEDGKTAKAAKIVAIVGLSLLGLCFLLMMFFTFSMPLPASFMDKLFR